MNCLTKLSQKKRVTKSYIRAFLATMISKRDSSDSDLWIDRNANCTTFATGISNALNGNDSQGYSWFLN